jgi:hypothetical protein
MKTLRARHPRLAGLAVGLGGLALLLIAPQARAEDEKVSHPLHRANRELHEAKKELEKAGHDFGGHKEAAIKDIDHASKHLDRLGAWVKKHHKQEWEQEHKDEKRAEEKGEKYPRLHAAVHELRRAHKYVKESQYDFGDNKQKELALKDLDRAIHQIDKALVWAKENGK